MNLSTGQDFGENYIIKQNLLTSPHRGHEVYLVEDKTTKELLVAKCATSKEANQALLSEQKILQDLSGIPGIPQSVAYHNQVHFVKYIDTQFQLGQYVRVDRPVDEQIKLLPWVERWFKQCVEILKMTHNKNIMHGDMKPQNIVVDKDNKVWLVDWDHARRLPETTPQLPVEGTPQYMSPEHVAGKTLDEWADWYALGMSFFSICYGSRLTPRYSAGDFKQRVSKDIVAAIAAGEGVKYNLLPKPRSPLETDLQSQWRKMTEYDKTKRTV
ncbi:MAG: protein kinase [Patescibacteria group bacterium]|jgi:serine/threonine protein kinase